MTATSMALDLVPDSVRGLPGVWIVGGAVRDVLLGRAPRELDLLVEGAAGPVVHALGEPTAVHERFGTFTVAGIDVTAARREIYARPGALPDVELGATVAEDLARRDFTVNAIAVRVSDGHVEAWPGALEDLDARVLRVLHDRSFVDDPTRALRMARYAARLDFGVEPGTARLAADVDFGTVSGPRIGAELRLALTEPPSVWGRLAEVGVPLTGFAVPPFIDDLEGLAALWARACWTLLTWRRSWIVSASRPRSGRSLPPLRMPARSRRDSKRRRCPRRSRPSPRASRPKRWPSPPSSERGRPSSAGSRSGATSGPRSPVTTSSPPACPARRSGTGCGPRWASRSTTAPTATPNSPRR